MTPRRFLGWLLIALFSYSLPLFPQDALQSVEIAGSQLLKLTSVIVPGQEYAIQVNLPGNYSDTTQRYPVIYVLDGQWDFPLVTALYGQLYYDGFIPASIVVGITWGGKNPKHDSLRARDFTPSHNASIPQSGNGAAFLSFIMRELSPFIESKFRTTGDRTLMGSSFGGLFTLYAMFHEPAFFQRYIAASPAIGWNRMDIASDEEKFARSPEHPAVSLYMAIGEYEDAQGFQRFVDRLQSRSRKGLRLGSKVLENTGHSGSKAEGFTRGLQFVFARPSLDLDLKTLNEYTGVYQVGPGMTVTLFVEQGRLHGRTPEGTVLPLQAESKADFYVKGQFLFLHMKRDETGMVTGFQLDRYGSTMFVRKIK